jgi:translation elongation factor EF-G
VLNECLALEDRGPIKDKTLRDRVQRAQPVRHPDGRVWGAEDWFACYIGKLEGPAELWPRQDDIDAETETKRLRTLFDQAAESAGMRPVSAAMQVLRKAGDLPMEQVVAIENALFAGERLQAAILPIARQALEAWVKEAAPELLSPEGETSS